MTGPEHYAAAERTLDGLDEWDVTDPAKQPIVAQLTAEAQVHATLALAAATALATIAEMPQADFVAWLRATATEVSS